jgi:uncharacterized protein YbjT (DUF2867 family)
MYLVNMRVPEHILLTGGTGNLGRTILTSLSAHGHHLNLAARKYKQRR